MDKKALTTPTDQSMLSCLLHKDAKATPTLIEALAVL
jgi:hypothetical protein